MLNISDNQAMNEKNCEGQKGWEGCKQFYHRHGLILIFALVGHGWGVSPGQKILSLNPIISLQMSKSIVYCYFFLVMRVSTQLFRSYYFFCFLSKTASPKLLGSCLFFFSWQFVYSSTLDQILTKLGHNHALKGIATEVILYVTSCVIQRSQGSKMLIMYKI